MPTTPSAWYAVERGVSERTDGDRPADPGGAEAGEREMTHPLVSTGRNGVGWWTVSIALLGRGEEQQADDEQQKRPCGGKAQPARRQGRHRTGQRHREEAIEGGARANRARLFEAGCAIGPRISPRHLEDASKADNPGAVHVQEIWWEHRRLVEVSGMYAIRMLLDETAYMVRSGRSPLPERSAPAAKHAGHSPVFAA